MSNSQQPYQPPVVFHPGETLEEKLCELQMGPKEFSIRTGKPEKTISAVLKGESSITPDMALRFEDVLRIPAHVWLSLQCSYDEYRAREERKKQLKRSVEWARSFPYTEMAKKGWVPPATTALEKAEALCEFFGMSGHSAWEDYFMHQRLKVAFRLSLRHARQPHAVSAWLRQGEVQATDLNPPPFRDATFKQALEQIRDLMVRHPSDILQQLQAICLDAGVMVVYTPCVHKAPINGCSRWINENPVIQLSDRQKRNDVFWFTFFHEAGHILLHGKKDIFLEDIEYSDVDREKESEANAFAVRWTLGSQGEELLGNMQIVNEGEIVALAKQLKTHPALVVGRLRRDKKVAQSFGHRFMETIVFK
jgi:HTH-type transcriptional regulator/antitoxin HigA